MVAERVFSYSGSLVLVESASTYLRRTGREEQVAKNILHFE